MQRTPTLSSRFVEQLGQLMSDLDMTSSNYVRCVKPTNLQRPGLFDNGAVLEQLRNTGTNESLELMCAGFPSRLPYEQLAGRFRASLPPSLQARRYALLP